MKQKLFSPQVKGMKTNFLYKNPFLYTKTIIFADITFSTMTRKLFLLHLLCFCCLLSAQATGQISDLIIIGKDTFMLEYVPDTTRYYHRQILLRKLIAHPTGGHQVKSVDDLVQPV